MDPREHWRSVYQAKRPDEVSWYQPSPDASLTALDRIGATPSSSLVDVGAGASTLVDALIERGWSDLTLVDIAEPALEATRVRLGSRAGKARWEIADIRHWHPGQTFDVWHDRAAFHFLTDAGDRTLYKRALIERTHPGSHVIIATFALDGHDTCSGLSVRRYDASGLAAELGDRFALVDSWPETHATPLASDQRFQWSLFQRN
jgi:trans-aconitate methyltransferase